MIKRSNAVTLQCCRCLQPLAMPGHPAPGSPSHHIINSHPIDVPEDLPWFGKSARAVFLKLAKLRRQLRHLQRQNRQLLVKLHPAQAASAAAQRQVKALERLLAAKEQQLQETHREKDDLCRNNEGLSSWLDDVMEKLKVGDAVAS